MHIAYLISQYPKVSHSFVRREILALESMGFKVSRLAVRGWDLEVVDPEDIAERQKTNYILQKGGAALLGAALAELRRAPARFFGALRTAWALSRRADRSLPYHLTYFLEACWASQWLQAHGVNHLHAHFGTNPAEVALLVHALCGVRYSFTVHGPEEFDKPEFLHLREKIHAAAFVVGVSSYGRSQLMRWADESHWHKLKVVHCGLDDKFISAPASPVPDVPRLLCIGRLSGQKGQLVLLQAAAQLAREGVPFELVLAGDGEMRPQIERAIATHGLQRHVRITGWISADQVAAELQACRAMVLPSFAEGLPVVLMEAMALGRPVLTTFIAGIPELVIHGENGWLFPAGDVERLAAVMKECLAAPLAELQRLGAAARTRAQERHDARCEAAKLAALIEAASSGASQGGSAA